jgi:RNA polymerase sigma-70 factor (ECF subfamily)
LNALRAKTRREGYEVAAGKIAFEHRHTGNPAREVELAEERHQVRLTLSNMKKRSAKILILRHSGFSYSEIAKVIGVSSTSVGTLVSRAEREFKVIYQSWE